MTELWFFSKASKFAKNCHPLIPINSTFRRGVATGDLCSRSSQSKAITLVLNDWGGRFGLVGTHKVLHLLRGSTNKRRTTEHGCVVTTEADMRYEFGNFSKF